MAYDLLLRRQIQINVARRSTDDAPLPPVARTLAASAVGVALICAALEPTVRRRADRRRYLRKFHDEFEGNTEMIPTRTMADLVYGRD